MNRKATPQAANKKGKSDSAAAEEEPLPEFGNDTFSLPNGAKYVGEWKRFESGMKRHGKGTYTCEEFTYDGDFEEDMFHGKGTLTYKDGDVYSGQFKHGQITGKGELNFTDGSRYVGQFREGKMHGLGTFYTIYGEQWRGIWNNGLSQCPIFPQAPPAPEFQEEEEEALFEEEDMCEEMMEEEMMEDEIDPNEMM